MEIIDDQPEGSEAEPQPELDGVKIRHLAALRRGAIRARSWCLIAVCVCAVGAVQLLINAIQGEQARHEFQAIVYVGCAIAAVVFVRFFLRRAKALKLEIDTSKVVNPGMPPDFSGLGDGKEAWRNLEEIQ